MHCSCHIPKTLTSVNGFCKKKYKASLLRGLRQTLQPKFAFVVQADRHALPTKMGIFSLLMGISLSLVFPYRVWLHSLSTLLSCSPLDWSKTARQKWPVRYQTLWEALIKRDYLLQVPLSFPGLACWREKCGHWASLLYQTCGHGGRRGPRCEERWIWRGVWNFLPQRH